LAAEARDPGIRRLLQVAGGNGVHLSAVDPITAVILKAREAISDVILRSGVFAASRRMAA
jgi:hypothetical protein